MLDGQKRYIYKLNAAWSNGPTGAPVSRPTKVKPRPELLHYLVGARRQLCQRTLRNQD